MKPPSCALFYTAESKRAIARLDPSVRSLIQKAVESLARNPERGKPLPHDLSGLRSLRTSDYRIIYRIRGGELIVLIVAIGHRRDVYKKLKNLITLVRVD